MATYSLLASIFAPPRAAVAADITGGKIYYDAGNIYQVDVATGVETSLGKPAASGNVAHHSLVYWKGNLYCAWSTSTRAEWGIYRWDGGTTWTLVHGAQGTNWLNTGLRLFATDDYLIALTAGDYDTDGWGAAHSANGSSWSESEIAGALTNFIAYVPPSDYWFWPGTLNPQGGNDAVVEARFNTFSTSSGTVTRLYKFNPATQDWEDVLGANYSTYGGETTRRFQVVGPDGYYWETRGTYNAYYSDDLSTWNLAPDASTTYPLPWVNMPFTVGRTSSGTALQWDPTVPQWDALDTFTGASYGTARMAIRMDDGYVYLLTQNGSNWYILERSEPLLDPVVGGQFYYGQNTPTLRSSMPVANIINPNCMLVRDNGDVIVGSGIAAATMVALATSADNYATWTDITGSLDTNPVVAVRQT